MFKRAPLFGLLLVARVLRVLDTAAVWTSLQANFFAQWCVMKQMDLNKAVRRARGL